MSGRLTGTVLFVVSASAMSGRLTGTVLFVLSASAMSGRLTGTILSVNRVRSPYSKTTRDSYRIYNMMTMVPPDDAAVSPYPDRQIRRPGHVGVRK